MYIQYKSKYSENIDNLKSKLLNIGQIFGFLTVVPKATKGVTTS